MTRRTLSNFIVITICLMAMPGTKAQSNPYKWLEEYDSTQGITRRITVPDGYERVASTPGSFADWLRKLPLKKGNPPIRYYNGQEKHMQEAHYAVVDIDVGDRDLQQCADAVIRFRAEYLYAAGRNDSIAFDFTSGDKYRYIDWLSGRTPVITGDKVSWQEGPARENNRANFREYLDIIFMYAGSYSLSKELVKVTDPESLQIGDIFIRGGFPGHAVIIVDAAQNIRTGQKKFLIAQSYTPAQDIHIIKLFFGDPWFNVSLAGRLWTLEWVFKSEDLRRFK